MVRKFTDVAAFEHEKKIMQLCDSEFICRLQNSHKDDYYMYMELELNAVLGGSVLKLLQEFTSASELNEAAKFSFGCVAFAFDYLHSKNIIYRNLQLKNLMIDSKGYVKLVDFRFAQELGVKGNNVLKGTPEYHAPEIVNNIDHDRAVDYWSLGILIYEIFTKRYILLHCFIFLFMHII